MNYKKSGSPCRSLTIYIPWKRSACSFRFWSTANWNFVTKEFGNMYIYYGYIYFSTCVNFSNEWCSRNNIFIESYVLERQAIIIGANTLKKNKSYCNMICSFQRYETNSKSSWSLGMDLRGDVSAPCGGCNFKIPFASTWCIYSELEALPNCSPRNGRHDDIVGVVGFSSEWSTSNWDIVVFNPNDVRSHFIGHKLCHKTVFHVACHLDWDVLAVNIRYEIKLSRCVTLRQYLRQAILTDTVTYLQTHEFVNIGPPLIGLV